MEVISNSEKTLLNSFFIFIPKSINFILFALTLSITFRHVLFKNSSKTLTRSAFLIDLLYSNSYSSAKSLSELIFCLDKFLVLLLGILYSLCFE